MSEDRAEGLDLDALKAVAQAAAEDAGGPWFATGRGAYVCSDPVEEDKIYRDGDGPIKGWLASADTTEIAKHMATFDPPTVLKLIALAQHDQARPGVEPVAWRWRPINGRRSWAYTDDPDNGEFYSARPDMYEVQRLALPTPIRGGIPEEDLGSDRCSGTPSDAQSVRPDGGEG